MKKSTNKYEMRVAIKLEKLKENIQVKQGILEDNEIEIYGKLKEIHTTPFVHGRGKIKSELQREIEEL